MARHHDGSEPWRIGVLFSRTGVTAVIEQSQLQGTLLAVEEVNSAGGVNGREVVPVIYDPGSDPTRFARYAHKLLTEDRVTMIFGCYTSTSRKAVVPLVERWNGLLWYPTLYEGFAYSPNVISTGAAPNQNSLCLVQYLMERFGDRFYFVGSDYVYPRESNRIMREFIAARKGTIVGEQYVDLQAARAEYKAVIREVGRAQPEVVFSTVVGEATSHLYQAYCDAGLNPATMPLASLTTSEAEIRLMGADVGCGHYTSAPYFERVDTDQNASFVARYKRRFGADEPTNMCVEAAYFQVHVFARALAEIDSIDTDLVRMFVLGSEFDAPQGVISIDPETSHTQLWTRIGRAGRDGQFEIVLETLGPSKPDPYLICQR